MNWYIYVFNPDGTPLVEIGSHLPDVYDISVHVNQTDVTGDHPRTFSPNLGTRMIADRAVIRDEDVAAVGLIGIVDRRSGWKHGLG